MTFFILNENDLGPKLKINYFTADRVDRVGRGKGGVSLFLSDSFSVDTEDIFSKGYGESVSVRNKANI